MAILTKRITYALVVFSVGLLTGIPASADGSRRFDLFDGKGGATCEFFNRDALLRWKNRQGDWNDAAGTVRGTVPFSAAHVDSEARSARWDVTALARSTVAGSSSKQLTILLKVLDPASASRVFFMSREVAEERLRPRLTVTDSDGRRHAIPPLADTMLQCSTARSLGGSGRLTVAANSYAALQYDLERFVDHQISRAEIEMTTIEVIGGPVDIGVFELDVPRHDARSPKAHGIAAKYFYDGRIEGDPDVIMATGFEEADWRSAWGDQTVRGTFDIIEASPADQFVPLSGHALRVTIPKGENLGLDLSFSFKEQVGTEPEELYFRYYLRFSDNWRPTLDGGKLPGMSGTYGVSGWGGRKSDGNTGWSMRGQFYRLAEDANPMSALTTIGTYAYHSDTQDNWGDAWPWTDSSAGFLERNRWYCIEQYVRLNTPGNMDGVLKGWVDGVLAFERTNVRYRNTPRLKIEKVWMNIYHGGKATASSDLRLFIDNVVIARRYVGPLMIPN